MSHPLRYVKVNYGDHCFYNDSSFKRYNRAHLGGDTLIFNFFNGCGCGGYMPTTCCSGLWGGFRGFWGGLGAGLGMGIMGGLMGVGMNLLGGWLGGLMGGCGCGNGVGGGSAIGGQVSGSSSVGAGSASRDRVLSTGKSSETKPAAETHEDKGDKPEETTLPKELEDAGIIKEVYDAYKKAGIDNNNLIILLVEGGLTDPAEIAKLKDLGLDVSKNDKSMLDGVKPENLEKLPKGVAAALLKHIGYIDDNGEGKLSNDYKVLLLLQASGVNVQVEHRSESDDPDVKGPISNVKNTDGIISYNVDCTKTGKIGGKYTLTATDKDAKLFTAKSAEENPDYNVNEEIELEFVDDKSPLQNKSGKPLVTRK